MVPVVQDFLVNAERITGIGQAEILEFLKAEYQAFNESKTQEYIRAVQEYKTRKVQEMVEKRFANNPHCPYHPEAITYGTSKIGPPGVLKNGGQPYEGWEPGWECQVGGLACYYQHRAEKTIEIAKTNGYFERVNAE
jgi:hypothetical protein